MKEGVIVNVRGITIDEWQNKFVAVGTALDIVEHIGRDFRPVSQSKPRYPLQGVPRTPVIFVYSCSVEPTVRIMLLTEDIGRRGWRGHVDLASPSSLGPVCSITNLVVEVRAVVLPISLLEAHS